jgi:hypothetical protein
MTPANTHRFPIGTQFTTSGKHPRVCTVTDRWTVTNEAGEVVRVSYVATHVFMGQPVTERDICETTVARNQVRDAPGTITQ